jgi:hypothetical protein
VTAEEVHAWNEAIKLLRSVLASTEKNSLYYEDHIAVELTPHKELALMIIVMDKTNTRLDVAQQSFRMGVYLGLQLAKLQKIY